MWTTMPPDWQARNLPTNVITSSNYPGQYDTPVECTWTLYTQTSGHKVYVELEDLNIGTSSDDCSTGELSIEVGDSDTVLCGQNLPAVTTYSGQSVSVTFKAQEGSTGNGFRLSYTAREPQCGGELTGTPGNPEEVQSPNYPSNYPNSKQCRWSITGPPGSKIEVTILEMEMEYTSSCAYDWLKVYDGSQELAKLCHRSLRTSSLPKYMSTGNSMTMHFRSDGSVTRKGFVFRYEIVEGCGANFTGQSAGSIRSEDYMDSGSEPHTNCQWAISVAEGKAIKLTISDFDNSPYYTSPEQVRSACGQRGLSIYAKDDDTNGPQLLTSSCSLYWPEFPSVIVAPTSEVVIEFQRVDSGGFQVQYEEVDMNTLCEGNLASEAGVFASPPDPSVCDNDQQSWLLTVSDGNTVEVRLVHFSPIISQPWRTPYPSAEYMTWATPVPDSQTNEPYAEPEPEVCQGTEIKVYGGSDETAPLLDRHCNYIPYIIRYSGHPQLFIQVTNNPEAGYTQSFIAQYQAACYYNLTSSSGVIQSENYPNNYPDNSLCVWDINAPGHFNGNRIRLNFEEFDLAGEQCQDYVQVKMSASLRDSTFYRYCANNNPPQIPMVSPGNTVSLVMRSDSAGASTGFKATYEMICQQTLNADRRGSLIINTEPDRNCTWELTTYTSTRRIYLEMNLSEFPEEDPCETSYVVVTTGDGTENRYCGQSSSLSVDFPGPSITVQLVKPDSADQISFRLNYRAAVPPCEHVLTDTSGEITTPNYPSSYPNNVDCSWVIEGEEDSIVTLTFEDFGLEQASRCRYDRVQIFTNPTSFSNGSALTLCSSGMPDTVNYTSNANRMLIKFQTDGSVVRKGFKATYTINSPDI